MITVGVIGVGNLGLRHLQSILNLEKVNVIAIDSSTHALEKAKKLSQSYQREITMADKVDDLPDLDIAIIATNSYQRKELTKKVIASTRVKHIVFEKIVFPALADYDEMGHLLDENQIKGWINCPMRMYPMFKQIREELESVEQLRFTVSGNNWGLGTTSIHLLDLLAFLRGSNEFTIQNDLQPEAIPSKRAGYFEVSGTISGTNELGDRFEFNSFPFEKKSPRAFHIVSEKVRYFFQDNQEYGTVYRYDNNWEEEKTKVNFPFQSQLTEVIIRDLMTTDSCELPSYASTAELHKNYIQFLISHFEEIRKTTLSDCPVT